MADYPNTPGGPFTGDPRNRFVINFKAAMAKCGRYTAADHTINAFVRAAIPPWLAERTLEELTLAIQSTPTPRRTGKVKLGVIDGYKKQ